MILSVGIAFVEEEAQETQRSAKLTSILLVIEVFIKSRFERYCTQNR